jgi:SAM-dependent methyltransferase
MTLSAAYVPSANKALRDGCPDRLAVVATLFGLSAAPPERARVLEIGCAEGVHLSAAALLAPDGSHFGIDLDPRAVARGNETIGALGLGNVKLECADFRTLTDRSERYDYVIVHGLYSWVHPGVRDALLSTLHELLDEQGVAYLSFNALPGSHAKSMLRDLVLPHVREIVDPRLRIERAREIGKELLLVRQRPGSAFALLCAEIEHFLRASDSLVHHDYLAEHSHGFRFGEFAERLEAHGLDYVTDANTLDRSAFTEHPLVIALGANRTQRLEFLDGLEMRRFRQAVVCHKGRSSGSLDFSRAERLWFASSAEPSARGKIPGSEPVRFKIISGVDLETTLPAIKAALYELGRIWPAALRLDDLSERVSERVGSATSAADLARLLLDSSASAAVRVFARAPRSVHAPGATPETTALARLEARSGPEVTNLHHEPVKVETPFHRELLALLDGTKHREALASALADAIEARRFDVPGIDPSARSRWESLLGREVDGALERLARYALLVA